jgi:hypothetical protein
MTAARLCRKRLMAAPLILVMLKLPGRADKGFFIAAMQGRLRIRNCAMQDRMKIVRFIEKIFFGKATIP